MVTLEEWLKREREKAGPRYATLIPKDGPGFEFEGPMGAFYGVEDVPDETLLNAIHDICTELIKRGIESKGCAELLNG